ncbi:hypothetical protein Hanom_Chr09g00834691 [Helianthus anomalus]
MSVLFITEHTHLYDSSKVFLKLVLPHHFIKICKDTQKHIYIYIYRGQDIQET